MVGALKIAGGVWEKSKNSRYPSGVDLIVYIKLFAVTDFVTNCPEIVGDWKPQTERKGRAKKGEKQY